MLWWSGIPKFGLVSPGPLINSFYQNLLVKGAGAHKQRPQKFQETLKFVPKKQYLKEEKVNILIFVTTVT